MALGPIAVALLESAADDALTCVFANLVLAHELARRVPGVAVLPSGPLRDDTAIRLSWQTPADDGADDVTDAVVVGIDPLRAVCAIARPLTPEGLRLASWELRARGEQPRDGAPYLAVLVRDPALLDDQARRRLADAHRVVAWSPNELGIAEALELRKDLSATELLAVVEAASVVRTDEPALVAAAGAYGRDVEVVGEPDAVRRLPVTVDGGRALRDELAWAAACDDLDDALDRAAAEVRSRARAAAPEAHDELDRYVHDLETALHAQTTRLGEQRTLFGEHLVVLEREEAERRAVLERELEETRAEADELRAEIDRLHATKIFRYTHWFRARYERSRMPSA